MPEDFHIIWDTATRWEGNVHYLMAPPLERIDVLTPMLEHLIQSQTDPSGNHICPICGQIFKIEFYKTELTTDPLMIHTFCKICNIYVFFRSNKIPVWAKDAPIEEWWAELRRSQKKNVDKS